MYRYNDNFFEILKKVKEDKLTKEDIKIVEKEDLKNSIAIHFVLSNDIENLNKAIKYFNIYLNNCFYDYRNSILFYIINYMDKENVIKFIEKYKNEIFFYHHNRNGYNILDIITKKEKPYISEDYFFESYQEINDKVKVYLDRKSSEELLNYFLSNKLIDEKMFNSDGYNIGVISILERYKTLYKKYKNLIDISNKDNIIEIYNTIIKLGDVEDFNFMQELINDENYFNDEDKNKFILLAFQYKKFDLIKYLINNNIFNIKDFIYNDKRILELALNDNNLLELIDGYYNPNMYKSFEQNKLCYLLLRSIKNGDENIVDKLLNYIERDEYLVDLILNFMKYDNNERKVDINSRNLIKKVFKQLNITIDYIKEVKRVKHIFKAFNKTYSTNCSNFIIADVIIEMLIDNKEELKFNNIEDLRNFLYFFKYINEIPNLKKLIKDTNIYSFIVDNLSFSNSDDKDDLFNHYYFKYLIPADKNNLDFLIEKNISILDTSLINDNLFNNFNIISKHIDNMFYDYTLYNINNNYYYNIVSEIIRNIRDINKSNYGDENCIQFIENSNEIIKHIPLTDSHINLLIDYLANVSYYKKYNISSLVETLQEIGVDFTENHYGIYKNTWEKFNKRYGKLIKPVDYNKIILEKKKLIDKEYIDNLDSRLKYKYMKIYKQILFNNNDSLQYSYIKLPKILIDNDKRAMESFYNMFSIITIEKNMKELSIKNREDEIER